MISSSIIRSTTINSTTRTFGATTRTTTAAIYSTSSTILNFKTKKNNNCYYSTTPISQNLIPIVLENSATGERSFDIYSRLLRERIICVHGQVTDQMASVVTAQLLFLEAEQPNKPVYMYINSPGGVVTAGMAMYDTSK